MASGSLAVNDIHDDSIDGFAQKRTADVINIIAYPELPEEERNARAVEHFPELIVTDGSLTFSSGSASIPSTCVTPLTLKVTTTSPSVTKKYARLLMDPDEFARWDSSNFVYTPNQERPVALYSDKVYIKPSTLTAGYLDYVKEHPAISGGTKFSPKGDNILIHLILSDYYTFIEEYDLANLHLVEAYGGTINSRNR